MDRPGGSPVADHEAMVPPPMSVATGVSPAIAVPDVELWLPGSATVTTSPTVQVNGLLVPVESCESVAVAVTE